MDLKAIQYVQEIVRSGSMTKAAERLYLSQSALSQYISRLEKSLDATIFRREANRLHLTPAGEIFLREGQNILSAYQHMCQHLRQANTNSNEIIRMGVSGFYGQFFLPRLFSAIKQDQLQIQLQVVQETSSSLQNLVREHVLDFCISPFGEASEDLVFEYLCTEEIMIALPSDSTALSQAIPGYDFPSLDISVLADSPFLMMREGQFFTPLGYRICDAAGFKPRVVCELMNWTAMRSLVAAKVGVSFLPREIARSAPKDGPISFCHVIAPIATTRPFMITTAKGRERSLAAQQTLRIIKSIASAPDFPF